MANIFDTAKYILEQCGEISAMKLQKLCYYSQAWALVWDEAPLFDEDFQAWQSGPVCPELFYENQGKFFVSADDEPDGDGDLSNNQKDTIDHVLEHYGDYDAHYLGQLPYMEIGNPWMRTREGILPETDCAPIITKESISSYYGGL